jgi:two-component system chemotaxis response regulator CheY
MGARILIVDDSGFARRTLRRILEGQGFTVEEAADGNQALEKYAASKPDVVFLDIIMEGMEGLEVLGKLLEMDVEAKVVMATADTQKATQEEAMKAGASGFVKKLYEK